MALNNNIKKEDYIVIDCRYSKPSFVKNNIIHSNLGNLFNLNDIVDWLECSEYALSNLVKTICELYNDKQQDRNSEFIKYIQDKFKIAYKTVLKYLKLGTEIKLCNYNPKESYSNIGAKVVLCLDNMKIYKSVTYLNGIFLSEFGIASTHSGISHACTHRRQYKNIKIMYLEDYNKEAKT